MSDNTTHRPEQSQPDDSSFEMAGSYRELASPPTEAGEITAEDQEERIFEIIEQDERYSERYAALQQERQEAIAARSQQREADAVALIRDLQLQVRREVYPDSLEESVEHKAIREDKLAALKSRFTSLDGNESDMVTLQTLGMIDDEGKFQYPADVFSSLSDELWHKYIEIVKEHNAVIDNHKDLGITNIELVAIDQERKRKHNELTRSIMVDLGLDADDGGEVFNRTRSLVVKMRDNKLPNMGELVIAARLSEAFLAETRRKMQDNPS